MDVAIRLGEMDSGGAQAVHSDGSSPVKRGRSLGRDWKDARDQAGELGEFIERPLALLRGLALSASHRVFRSAIRSSTSCSVNSPPSRALPSPVALTQSAPIPGPSSD